MKLNKKTFIRWKVYFDRARMYIGYANFFMMIVIFINSIKDNRFGRYLVDYSAIAIPLLIIIFVGGSLFLGYMDSRLGIRKEEMRNLSTANPVIMEIYESVQELKKMQEGAVNDDKNKEKLS